MTALETLGEFFAQPRPLSADVHGLLRLHVADTVAAWATGSRTPDGRTLRDLRASVAGDAADAAMAINCATTRMTEIDDIHIAAMITPGSIIVPAVLSIATSQNANSETVRHAIVAGYEAMIRFGLAIDGPRVLPRGVWATYFGAPLGVAAAASCLMRLDAKRTAHALAIALAKSIPGVGKVEDVVKGRWLAVGNAAVVGLQAARTASDGATAALDLFEKSYFQSSHDIAADASQLTGNLGERVMLREVAFKPWCAARQTMAATQAFKEMISRIDVASIEQIEVKVQPVFLKMLDHGIEANDRLSRLTSMPFQIAIAALDPGTAFNVGQTSAVSDVVSTFMEKVGVAADENLMEGFPMRLRGVVRIRVNGVWHEHETLDVPGDPAKPFDEHAIREKFHRVSGLSVDACDALIAEALDVIDGNVAPAKLLKSVEAAS